MSAYNNMVNDVGEATAVFIAMPETRQIAQPKNLLQQIYTGWANKMLPLFNHTQVFKCEFIQNFYSKICDKKH